MNVTDQRGQSATALNSKSDEITRQCTGTDDGMLAALNTLSKEKTMTGIASEEYKDALRSSICSMCICFAQDNNIDARRCIHENSGQCSLFAKLNDVVDVVSRVKSGSVGPYVEQLRHDVCAHCEHQDKNSVCDVRDKHGPVPNWCVLDAYFNLIVGTIEEVQQKHTG
jgi:hypothetical protein